jgi:large subunit ribosomal protein L29
MKAKDMREKSPEDLRELEKSLARDAFQAKLKNFTNRLDDTSQIRKVKRDLARVKTLLGEIHRKAAHGAAASKPAKSTPALHAAPLAKGKAPKAKKTSEKTAAKKPATKTAKARTEASK